MKTRLERSEITRNRLLESLEDMRMYAMATSLEDMAEYRMELERGYRKEKATVDCLMKLRRDLDTIG